MKVGGNNIPWSKEECARAAEILKARTGTRQQACELIAKALQRSVAAVSTRLSNHGSTFFRAPKPRPKRVRGPMQGPRVTTANFISTAIVIPAEVITDRDRRRQLEPTSVTAMLMGDPLPGRSALDRQQHRAIPLRQPPKISAITTMRNNYAGDLRR